jgi:tRNA1Val (adenine37-N6)-methyltransferase
MPKNTTDTFFDGALSVVQSRSGYRFSIDAILLASALEPKTGQTVVDLGTGCGIIPLILAYRYPDIRLYGVEMQTALVELARTNSAQNRMTDRVHIVPADIRRLTTGQVDGPVDLVVCNPPYHRVQSGRLNPNPQRAIARHEIHLNLEQLLSSVRRILRTGGRFATIYPAERIVDLFYWMRRVGIEPKQMRAVHSRRTDGARRILAQGVMRGNPGVTVHPPLVIYTADGKYTNEVQQMMEARYGVKPFDT